MSRIPDGETGPRQAFVVACGPILEETSWLVADERGLEDYLATEQFAVQQFSVRPGIDLATETLPALGYAGAALASYQEFRDLKDRGIVPSTATAVAACRERPTAVRR